MADNNILNNIALCRKAGFIVLGFDAVVAEISSPKSKTAGVIITSDLSEKSKKEITFHCDKHGIPVTVINETMSDTEQITGKRTGIIAVLNSGFYNKFKT